MSFLRDKDAIEHDKPIAITYGAVLSAVRAHPIIGHFARLSGLRCTSE